MASSTKGFRVLIIGGGNCGLSIATGLKKAGISCTVFERDSEYEYNHNTRDWGMLLHWGTEYFEENLPDHLLKRVKEARVDPKIDGLTTIPYLNGETGELMRDIELPTVNRVSRKKIRKLLTEGEDLDIQFNKKLKSISTQGKDVIADFEDGSREVGNMLVGCDGSHSKVRECVVGKAAAQLEDTGHTMINYPAQGYTPAQVEVLRSRSPIMQLAHNHSKVPGAALVAALDITDSDDTATWKFQTYTSWSGPPHAEDLQDPAVRMKFVRERMAQFCEPFRTAFLAVDENEVMPVYTAHQWAPSMSWNNYEGKITIAGDAAHSVLPHRGQGLNNAMKDAADIVDAIKSAVEGVIPLQEGISAYEEEMQARGTKEVELSYEQMLFSNKGDLKTSPMFTIGHLKNHATADATVNGTAAKRDLILDG